MKKVVQKKAKGEQRFGQWIKNLWNISELDIHIYMRAIVSVLIKLNLKIFIFMFFWQHFGNFENKFPGPEMSTKMKKGHQCCCIAYKVLDPVLILDFFSV